MTLSSRDRSRRLLAAARSPQWSLGLDRTGTVMATRDSGRVGFPWVVTARARGRVMRVSFYSPGDDTGVDGELIGELAGNPREMGRQLRAILEGLDGVCGPTAPGGQIRME